MSIKVAWLSTVNCSAIIISLPLMFVICLRCFKIWSITNFQIYVYHLKKFYIDPLNYLNGQGDQVVYANNFFSGQTSECQNAATHTETASNGDDPNYTGANLFGGLWSGTCGTSNIFQNSVSSRIVGGEETAEHQYPWMVCFFLFIFQWVFKSICKVSLEFSFLIVQACNN